MKNSPIIYQGKNGGIELNLDTEQDTIWATQTQIAELFKVDRTSVTRHINNIYSAGELDEKVVCAFFEHTTPHGALKNKTQVQKIKAYSLDMIEE